MKEGNNEFDDFVTIMTFTYPTELVVLRAQLEDDEIECRVLNELTVQVYPFYSNAIGGIKLQVKESDLQRATELLKAGGYIKKNESQPSENINQLDDSTSGIKCTKCGSVDVLKKKISGPVFAISLLLLGFPLPFMSKMYHCFDCGEDFKRKKIF